MPVEKYDIDQTGLVQISETGNWIKASDYHALEKLVEELSRELSRSQRLLWEPVN